MESHLNAQDAYPAPYGKACEECQKSKTKCMLREPSGRCERCKRLDQDCHPSKSRRRRTSDKDHQDGTSSKGAPKAGRLEHKLDELTKLVKQSIPAATVEPIGSERPRPASLQGQARLGQADSVDTSANLPVARSYPISDWCPIQSAGTDPLPVDAEVCLDRYRKHHARFFPFVHIPPTVTAQQLHEDRSFLLYCITAIASPSTLQLRKRSRIIKRQIAERIVVEGQKSTDLLQGLLVFSSWFQHQSERESKSTLSTFVSLAVSLVFDLGLNKSAADIHVPLCTGPHHQLPPQKLRTLDDYRAVLGVFYLSSVMSRGSQTIDAMRWTPYMRESCLHTLRVMQAAPSDTLLVHIIDLQLVIERAATVSWHEVAFEDRPRAPSALYIQPFAMELAMMKGMTVLESDNEIRTLHLHTAELVVSEIALSQPSGLSPSLDTLRLKHMNACLESIREWFEVFFTIPPEQYAGATLSIVSQNVRCLALLYHLSTLEDPSWSKDYARSKVDLLEVLDKLISNLVQVPALASIDNEGCPEMDVFTRTAKLFQRLRREWATKLGVSEAVSTAAGVTVGESDELGVLEDIDLDWLDYDWIMNFAILPSA